ncbi:hypothetical protein WCU79_02415, partial [Pectobacterium versatile]
GVVGITMMLLIAFRWPSQKMSKLGSHHQTSYLAHVDFYSTRCRFYSDQHSQSSVSKKKGHTLNQAYQLVRGN